MKVTLPRPEPRGWSIDGQGSRDRFCNDSCPRCADGGGADSSTAIIKRRDEVSVGIVITVAVVVLLLGTLWLIRGGLKNGYPLHTRFAWGQNLKQGQPVLLAGVSVGYVGDVTLRRDGYLDVLIRVFDQY